MKCRLGEILDERGIKRKWVAEQIGVSQKQVSNWIACRSYPTVEKAFAIAELLGVKVDDLYKKD
ncbi:helix-turn-helix transcriptional regulator [Fredinandcohnia sp. 179-A 10B2 NHS]|uniref:helix-turn-helix transcriptional regulator n=1 Tax=Fredinandcohnia sp. 179-A 10B2 NHS TaxID=3235176 RepID=UPI0039A0F151